MQSILVYLQNSIFGQDRTFFIYSLLLSTSIAIIIWYFSLAYIKCVFKRWIRILCRKIVLDPKSRKSDRDSFVSFYRKFLCHQQKVNNELLRTILQKNCSCRFFLDRSITFESFSFSVTKQEQTLVDEFRDKVPLSTYDDYHHYIVQMVDNGEKNLICSEKIIYYPMSTGTTGTNKILPMTSHFLKSAMMLSSVASSVIWRSLPTSFPSSEQRWFLLQGGKKREMFARSKDNICIGQVSQTLSAVPSNPIRRILTSAYHVIGLDLIENITDFETNTFVQLVFALMVPDIYSYSIIFAPAFVHTIKMIETYFEEMCLCISSTDFDHSSLVCKNINDMKFRRKLNQTLNEVSLEYGGLTYCVERAEFIRNQCHKINLPGILHRLWPKLVFATTALGGSFATYKEEIQFYCGEKLPLINQLLYSASEGCFGILASIHTDEYILSPASAFYEFIKEQDIHQEQPRTYLISEIEPGNRYELVCTTQEGLVRYRMGDIVICTRFYSHTNDLVSLPSELTNTSRIPLVSIAYRLGSILDIFGEKTTEQHVMYALKETIYQWRNQKLLVDLCDFTSYPKLDVFPPRYVIFLELTDEKQQQQQKDKDRTLKNFQDLADSEIEQQLCKANNMYRYIREAGKLSPLTCILVRNGTFSNFHQQKIMNDQISAVQIKPRRLLKNEEHIQFFYDNQTNISSS